MKKHKIIIILLLFFAFFASLSYAAQDSLNSFGMAPDFQLGDLNDRVISLSDYKGKKAVMLFFWTTWCPYCREELNVLNQEYSSLVKDSIEVLTINVEEPRYKVEKYVRRSNLGLEVLLDSDSLVARDYGLMGVPAYFVINKSGEVVSAGNHFPKNAIKELAGR
ncbi:MAG: TlpA disulfide reductase family protein [Candidatus Omnitrophica bacterium]|nr:TlpA disulfide reductase family protein [Candidatus Omnitrophota bacterium]